MSSAARPGRGGIILRSLSARRRAERTLTFAELDREPQAVAAAVEGVVTKGDPVLLVYPPGLDFIVGFFGCVYAGAIAVPATYPKASRPMPRLSAIARDCGPGSC